MQRDLHLEDPCNKMVDLFRYFKNLKKKRAMSAQTLGLVFRGTMRFMGTYQTFNNFLVSTIQFPILFHQTE